MWTYITENNCGNIKEVFNVEEDEFLADRGFLYIKEKEGMFKLQCSVGLSPNQKQLSTKDANNSRLVTRFRNVVERAFGRFKSNWKIISNVISNGLWPKIHQLLRLLAAIENAFFSPLWNDKESDKRDAEAIVQKLDMENELQKIFESKEKTQWLKQSSEDILNSSPSLSLEDIRNWSIGPYALTLAKPYIEHNPELKFWKHKKLENIFKIKGLTSRFVTSDSKQAKKYTVLLKILKDNSEILTYCTCKSGARTLGGCAHSCAILYYLTVDKIGERSNAAQKKSISIRSD